MTDFDAEFAAGPLVDIFDNGRDMQYHSKTGTIKSIKAFLDDNYISSPGSYESNVAEPTTVIGMQVQDVAYITRGEILVDVNRDNQAYEVISINTDESDGLETVVNVRKVDR